MNNIKVIFFTSLITVLFVSIAFVIIYKTILSENEILFDSSNATHTISTDNSFQQHAVPIETKIDETESNLNFENNEVTFNRRNIITETVKNVSPAVVGINVTEIQKVRVRSPFEYFAPEFRQFFGDKIYEREIKGLGSGVIISPDGYILTNDHVAGNAVEAIVTMTNGDQYKAKIVGTDQASDICLLKIEGQNLPYVKFGKPNDIFIGEWVIALGNPFGLFEVNDKPTVTVGVVSATGMNLGGVNGRYYFDMIQTDASINGGNSGGPLVNSIGELIAINTLIYTAQGSSGSVGVGFAIPVSKIIKIVDGLKKEGEIVRDFWTGLKIQDINQRIANYYNIKNPRGVIITHVEKNSPADRAGLQVGDIVRKVDNYRITNDQSLIDLLYHYTTNDSINLTVYRDTVKINKILKLERNKSLN